MFRKLLGRKGDNEPQATRANLGEASTMYFDKEKNRWREKGKEHLEEEEDNAPPPPMSKPKEPEKNAGGADSGGPPPPGGGGEKKEGSYLDALIAPPNPYANRLNRGAAAKPPTAPIAAFGMAARPMVDPAQGDAATAPAEDEGAEQAAAGDDAPALAPAPSPFGATNPFGAKAAPVASNPFAPKGFGGGAASMVPNPNAPRAFRGEGGAPRRPPPKPAVGRASPFGAPMASPFGAAPSQEASADAEGAEVGEGGDDGRRLSRQTSGEAAGDGEVSGVPAQDSDAPEALPPTPSRLSAHMPAYSPFAPAAQARRGGLLQHPLQPAVDDHADPEGDAHSAAEEPLLALHEESSMATHEAARSAAESEEPVSEEPEQATPPAEAPAPAPALRTRASPFGVVAAPFGGVVASPFDAAVPADEVAEMAPEVAEPEAFEEPAPKEEKEDGEIEEEEEAAAEEQATGEAAEALDEEPTAQAPEEEEEEEAAEALHEDAAPGDATEEESEEGEVDEWQRKDTPKRKTADFGRTKSEREPGEFPDDFADAPGEGLEAAPADETFAQEALPAEEVAPATVAADDGWGDGLGDDIFDTLEREMHEQQLQREEEALAVAPEDVAFEEGFHKSPPEEAAEAPPEEATEAPEEPAAPAEVTGVDAWGVCDFGEVVEAAPEEAEEPLAGPVTPRFEEEEGEQEGGNGGETCEEPELARPEEPKDAADTASDEARAAEVGGREEEEPGWGAAASSWVMLPEDQRGAVDAAARGADEPDAAAGGQDADAAAGGPSPEAATLETAALASEGEYPWGAAMGEELSAPATFEEPPAEAGGAGFAGPLGEAEAKPPTPAAEASGGLSGFFDEAKPSTPAPEEIDSLASAFAFGEAELKHETPEPVAASGGGDGLAGMFGSAEAEPAPAAPAAGGTGSGSMFADAVVLAPATAPTGLADMFGESAAPPASAPEALAADGLADVFGGGAEAVMPGVAAPEVPEATEREGDLHLQPQDVPVERAGGGIELLGRDDEREKRLEQELAAERELVTSLQQRLAAAESLAAQLQEQARAAADRLAESEASRTEDSENAGAKAAEQLAAEVSRREAAEQALAQERMEAEDQRQDLQDKLDEAEQKREEAEARAEALDDRVTTLEKQAAEQAERKQNGISDSDQEARLQPASPPFGENSEEFNLPDFVWSCGNSEVMAFVHKLVEENEQLKRQQQSQPAVQALPFDYPTSQGPDVPRVPTFDVSDRVSAENAITFAATVSEHDGHQIKPLLALFEQHSETLAVCSQVCAALENLTFTDHENRKAISQSGGVEAILDMLKRFKDSEAEQLRAGVDALWNLTFEDEAVDRATEGGGIELIAEVMRQHPDVPELQSAACAVLLNLAVQEPNRWRIVQGGIAGLIFAAMQRHSGVEEVLEQGCQALYMLAYHPDLRPHIMASSGIAAARLAKESKHVSGKAQKWGKYLQEVLDC